MEDIEFDIFVVQKHIFIQPSYEKKYQILNSCIAVLNSCIAVLRKK